MKRKFLSVLLALALICLPIEALCELPADLVISEISEVSENIDLPAPASEAFDAFVRESSADNALESTESPVETAPEAASAVSEIVEPTPAASEETESAGLPELTPSPETAQINDTSRLLDADFDCGYVKLTGAATGYSSASPSAEATIYLEEGVFYASDRRTSSSGDRIRVHFSDGAEIRSVWIDARHLRSMSNAEIAGFISSRSGKSGVRYYGGDMRLPLDAPDYGSALTYDMNTQAPRASVPAMFVAQSHLCLHVGETLPVSVSFSDGQSYMVYFNSDDMNVASVSGDGSIVGISVGSTCIRLRSEHGNEAAIEIQVDP